MDYVNKEVEKYISLRRKFLSHFPNAYKLILSSCPTIIFSKTRVINLCKICYSANYMLTIFTWNFCNGTKIEVGSGIASTLYAEYTKSCYQLLSLEPEVRRRPFFFCIVQCMMRSKVNYSLFPTTHAHWASLNKSTSPLISLAHWKQPASGPLNILFISTWPHPNYLLGLSQTYLIKWGLPWPLSLIFKSLTLPLHFLFTTLYSALSFPQ